MARFFIENCVTLYHIDVFEADSMEEAREMRDSLTYEWSEHLDGEFLGRKVTREDLQTVGYVDMGEVDWDWDGPAIGKDEFKSRYTALDI